MEPIPSIAVAVERTSEYGRRFLHGVADYFDDKPTRQLVLINPADAASHAHKDYDGWICRITNRRLLTRLHTSGRPVVDALCLMPFKEFSTIRTDHQAISALAAEHLIAHHFTNFGFCGYRHVTFSDLRRNAFARYLEERGFRPYIYRQPFVADESNVLPSRLRELAEGPNGEAEDTDALLSWIARLPKPVAIFCCDDFRAADVARLSKRLNLRIPEDVAILGVDNDPLYCLFGTPRLSSIDPDASSLGFKAAQMLDERLSSGKVSSVTIPPKGIAVRASTDFFPSAPSWFENALSFISEGISRNISASDVFAFVGFSRTLVETVFRKQLGHTVQAEIASTRLAAAKRLLSTTTLQAKEIADRTGFKSLEYFSRTFRKATGLSPTDYRKNKSIDSTHSVTDFLSQPSASR